MSAYCKEQRKHPALRKKSKSVVFLRKEDSSIERGGSPNESCFSHTLGSSKKVRVGNSSTAKRISSSGNLSTRPATGPHSAFVSTRAQSLFNSPFAY